jgi:hypothetical protein
MCAGGVLGTLKKMNYRILLKLQVLLILPSRKEDGYVPDEISLVDQNEKDSGTTNPVRLT